MSKITVKTKKTTVTFDTPQDAAEFVAALEKGGAGRTRRAPRVSRKSGAEDRSVAVKLLDVLFEGGASGFTSEELAERMGVKGPRGLPAISTPAKRAISAVGFDFEDVVQIHRSPEGNRWKYTDETANALGALGAKDAQRR